MLVLASRGISTCSKHGVAVDDGHQNAPKVGDSPGVVRGCRGANVGVFAGSKLPLQCFLFPPARYLVHIDPH